MAEYGYEDLQKKIFDELKTVITESGEKAIASGLSEIMKKKFSLKGINIATKELTAFLDEEINRALTQTKPKKIRNFNYSLLGGNEKDIKKAVNKAYDEYMNADTSKQMELAVKNFVSAMEVAKAQSVKIAQDIVSEYNDIFAKDSTIGEFFSPKIITDFKDRVIKEISNINLKKILDESIGEFGTNINIDKTYGKLLSLDKDRTRVLSDIGLTEDEYYERLKKENEEIKKGNTLFREAPP